MNNSISSLSLVLAAVLPATALSAQSVTLFSDGSTLVRRTLVVEVPRGESTKPLVLGNFDPASLTILNSDVTLNRVSYDPGSDENAFLRRSIGKEFRFPMYNRGEVRARLLSMDPERWDVIAADSGTGFYPGVVFSRPGRLFWPPEMIPAEPVADVTLTAQQAQSSLQVMYQSPGGGWSASYRLFLGIGAKLEGTANINSGVLNLANAEVQLVAGDMGRASDYNGMGARDQVTSKRLMAVSEMSIPTNQSIGEVQLYSLAGRVTFIPGTRLIVPLFAPATVKPQLQLAVGGTMPYRGGISQMIDEYEAPVEVSYLLERKQGTSFGDLPIPAGGVKVFDMDKAGRWQLVGQGAIGHTGAGEEMEIRTGTAFDVTARRTQTDYSTTRERAPDNATRTIASIDQKVVITNAKDTVVTVDVREDRAGEWEVVNSSVPPVRKSSSRVVFPVKVPGKGQATLTYRLRVVW